MADAGGPPKLQIPRWIQLVGLPLLLLLAWVLATTAYHVVLVFVVAALAALLLDPVVRALQRVRIPRGLAVAIVYLSFLAALGLTIGALGTVAVDQTKTAANRVDAYFTEPSGRSRSAADHDVDRFQVWLDTHHLRQVKVQERGHRAVKQIREKDVGRYTTRVVDFVEGAAVSIGKVLFELVLLLVVSIYMLLDLPRLQARIDRRFPPRPGSGALVPRIEGALAGYVRGQALLSLIIGGSAGLGLWIFGVTGLLPGGDRYALLFGAWVALTEVIPYVGPWIGAVPPLVYALFVHPVVGPLGGAALPRRPPARGTRGRAERDGERPAPQPAARHLRPARRRRDLRARRGAARAAAARGGPRHLGVPRRAVHARALAGAGRPGSRRRGRSRGPAPSPSRSPRRSPR